jgi:asparaginyl-tRNA synthetase
MERVFIADIAQHAQAEVELRGWVTSRRSKGKIHFLTLRDGTGFIQATLFRGAVSDQVFEQADHLPQETAVSVQGSVRPDERAPGGFELSVSHLEVIALPSSDYPITPKEHGPEFLMDHRHLWLRHRRPWATLRIRDEIERAIHDFLHQRGFVRLDAPILTPNAVEGTSDLFEVDLFDGEKAYLSQSGQLYVEAGAMAFGKVYTFGPTFRAERSKTRRHLLEFWMIEPEVAFMTHPENMQLQEDLVSYLVGRVLEERKQELELLERDTSILSTSAQGQYPRLSYSQALEQVNSIVAQQPELGLLPMAWGDDFGAPHEAALSQRYDRPIFIEKYPAAIKAFYMQPDPHDPRLVLNADLLAPEGVGEIIGGSQRIHDLNLLRQKIAEHGLPESVFDWYLDLRTFGSVPHSGFGIGLERTVRWICGIEHIREAIPFARMYTRMRP